MPGLKVRFFSLCQWWDVHSHVQWSKMYSKPKMPEESFLPWKKGHRDSAMVNVGQMHHTFILHANLGWKKEHRRSVHPARITPWKRTPSKPEPRRECIWRPIAVDSSKLQQPRCEAAARRKVKQSEISNQLAKKNLGSMLDPKWTWMSFYFHARILTTKCISHQRTHGKPIKHMYDPILSQWLGFFWILPSHSAPQECVKMCTCSHKFRGLITRPEYFASLHLEQLIAQDF